jgi:predicted RNase H-like HicB family nuclease
MPLHVEVEQEQDGRWMAEVIELAGALCYGESQDEAAARAKALSLRLLADRLEHGEAVGEIDTLFSVLP